MSLKYIRHVKYLTKTPCYSYIWTRTTVSISNPIPHNINYRLLSNNNYVKMNQVALDSIIPQSLSNKQKYDIPFFYQKRHFSLADSIESAVNKHSSLFNAISGSSVVQYTQQFIVNFHDTTGLPWWLSIITLTCLVRVVIIVPLALYQSYVIAKLENARIEMEEIVNNIKYDLNREVRKNRWPEKKAKRYFNVTTRKEWTRLIERDNCHPAKVSILALIQIPLWVIFSTSFRNLVYMLPHQDTDAMLTRLGLSMGGVSWCTDLTVPDSFVIPIGLGLVNLAIVEVQAMMYKGQRSKLQRYVTNFFRGFSIFMIPVSATVPSAVSLYWLTSSVFGLCQNLFIISPRVRRLVGIPPSPSSHSHPYVHLAHQIKSKFVK